jgi:hypothetical protein
MTTTKMILIAATGAAVTFALLLLAINNLGAKPPGALGERLVILLIPAEIIGETFGTRASFLMAGFLEFFLAYLLGLLSWRCIRAGQRAE